MIVGAKVVESNTTFCTWHGIKNTNVYFDALAGIYGIAQDGIIIATKDTLSEICKFYVEATWGKAPAREVRQV